MKAANVQLTKRQRDVLRGWWVSETTAETAKRLNVKPGTVRFYRDQARLRLGNAPDMQAAVRRAVKLGLLKGTA